MIEILLSVNGVILGLISLLALAIYWQVSDLLQQLFLGQPNSATQLTLCLLRCRQLAGWITVLPLLGLLGTVSGLLNSFSGLASDDQQVLTGGIAEALLTTQLGLTTALPALLLLMLCQRRCERGSLEAACIDIQ
ncbi:Biopolymer transport protein [Shewanella piezotolerans WP3]|uniref:Biopolymer transport protein n=1 Tax=Shewanella piezotolerans (strain WP3 / JCM 13877) TaxID=225849 RepID=B8CV93_SHEPW|nr:MotA/TolQ/ExbB proton channel family protein [Shewanella piezotolerans]ACJ31569.1 Biopolymer transport protein [Shewanella piezotolerans WP3]